MLAVLLLNMIVLAQVPTTAPTEASAAPAVEGTPTTQPTVQVEAEAGGIEVFSKTTVGQLFAGERKLTAQEAVQLEFWLAMIKDLLWAALAFIPRLFVAVVFLLVSWLVYRGVRKLVVGSMTKANVDASIRDMLGSCIKWTVMGFGFVIACNQIGIPIVAMLTGVSIIGIAVGFAAQETLANFIAGIVIFWDKPFKIGDWVAIDGNEGLITRVTFRSTRLTNLDNDVVVLPNTMMLSSKLINKSSNQVTRATVPIGIAYKESIDHAREVLLKCLEGDPRIVTSPEPMVEVRNCNASSVDLMLHFWIREERYEDALVWEYLEKAKKALDAAGIEIPFPHLQVLLEETPALKALAGLDVVRPASSN